MCSDQVAIEVRDVRKSFPVYERPHHRLMQMLTRGDGKKRWYSEFAALKDVSFQVARGETLGVVGRNGSGKSTLLQIICGTLSPNVGEVVVNGRVAALLELGSGFNPEFTGRENVFLNGVVLGLDRREVEKRFDSIAAFADIGDFMERPVKTYSSGMYVRLAFAVAINVTPDILVVDEALSVGDEAFQRKCFARINKMRDEGVTILFVSHSAGTVTELCNRAILLDRGEMLMDGTPKDVVSHYHKLLYSPAEKYEKIRSEIIAGHDLNDIANEVIEEADSPTEEAVEGRSSEEISADNEADGSYYEEGMVPASTFRYESHGATIEDPHIETIDGRRVNMLQSGKEYVYRYRVHFDRAAGRVRCGMLIKSVRGLELAGAVTSWFGETLSVVRENTVLDVKFTFPCMLASGAYFLNAGVQGEIGNDDAYLDRCIDVAMFKVIHRPGALSTTAVDFGITSSAEALEGQVA